MIQLHCGLIALKTMAAERLLPDCNSLVEQMDPHCHCRHPIFSTEVQLKVQKKVMLVRSTLMLLHRRAL